MFVVLAFLGALGPGWSWAAPAPAEPVLARVFLLGPADRGNIAAAGLPVFADLFGRQGEYLLAGVTPDDAARLAALGLRIELLEAIDPAAAYYRVRARPGLAVPDPAAFGRVLCDDGNQTILRVERPDVASLEASGLELTLIQLRPKSLRLAEPAPVQDRAVQADADTAALLAQVQPAVLTQYEQWLTGITPITVGGESYTLQSRHTYRQTAIQKATQFALERFQALGLPAAYHQWGAAYCPNVIATQAGLATPDRTYIICAHLDDQPSGSTAPGADDNASGSTGVLVAADLIHNQDFYCDNTLVFALWTGEEQGMLGSYDWAGEASAAGTNILGVLNMDMIAYNSDTSPICDLHARSSLPGSVTLANLFADVVSAYGLDLQPAIYIDHAWGDDSDNGSFWDYGYPAIMVIEDEYDFTPYYHSTSDTFATLNLPYFTEMVKATLGTFIHLGGGLWRYGDLNRNRALEAADLVILTQHLSGNLSAGSQPFQAPPLSADVHRDQAVDALDLAALANYLAGN